jgi:hypothetical protein
MQITYTTAGQKGTKRAHGRDPTMKAYHTPRPNNEKIYSIHLFCDININVIYYKIH